MISNRIASPRDASVAVRLTLVGALFLAAVFLPLPAAGQDASALKRLALEDLMEVDVTSVSRRTEPISEAPAAIDVITGDQIRRSGVTNGLETEVTVRPTGWMRWQASWTMFDKHLEVRPGSGDLTGGAAEGNDPPHQLGIRTAINLPHRAELEGFLRRVAALPDPRVPAYTELDTRASWALSDDVEVAVIGRNLLHASHPEFGRAGPRRVEIERSLYARARASF